MDVSANLDTEKTRSIAAELKITTDLSAEILRANTAEGANITLIGDVSTNLASEITRATNAETANTILINDISSNLGTISTNFATKSDIVSPSFTGIPIAPTAASSVSTGQIATTEFVQTRIGEILDNAPVALDTLKELATALGDDSNFSATISTQLGTLTADLANETTRAATKENLMSVLITDLSGDLTSLTNVVNTLNTNANSLTLDVSANLAAEITRATAAEGANTTNTNRLTTDLSGEITRAIVAESANTTLTGDVSSNLAAEIVRATNAETTNATTLSDLSSNVGTINTNISTKSNIASPAFTGIPTAPTAASTINNVQIATTEFVQTRIGEILDNAPVALDTLKELATALGNDSNFSATISTQIGNLSSAISTETSRATTKESLIDALILDISGDLVALTTVVNNLTTNSNALTLDVSANLATEVTRATAAEVANTALSTRITTDLSGEINRATIAESANTTLTNRLTTDLSGEITRAIAVENINRILINDISSNVGSITTNIASKSDIASPSFTGIPVAPTAASSVSTGQIATTEFVQTRISEILDSAPVALDTLNELAAALGDDSNFSATMTSLIGDISTNIANEKITCRNGRNR